MASSEVEVEKTYVEHNHAFLSGVLSQPLISANAEANKRAFMQDFASADCFTLCLQEMMKANAQLLASVISAARSKNQGNAVALAFLEAQKENATWLSLDELKKQRAELLSNMYNYIFTADGNYTEAFLVEHNGKNIDQYLAERGLTKRDLFWQYVQAYNSGVYAQLVQQTEDICPEDDAYLLQPTLNTVFNPFFGIDDNESDLKAADAFFEEAFFAQSKEEEEESAEQSSQPKKVQWLPTAQAEMQEQDKDFAPQKGILYVNQLTSGNLSFFYIDEKNERKVIKVPAEHFSPKPPAVKTKEMNQFCERLGMLKKTKAEAPFSNAHSGKLLAVISSFQSEAKAREKLDFEKKSRVVGYKKDTNELEVVEKETKQKQMLYELDETIEREGKAKQEIAQEEVEYVKPEIILLKDIQELTLHAVPTAITASSDIVRINAKNPLKEEGKEKTYQKVSKCHELENVLDIEKDDPRTFIPSIIYNLDKIEGLEWVDGLHSFGKAGPRKAKTEYLGEDERLYNDLGFGDPNQPLIPKDNLEYKPIKETLKLRIAQQKTEIKEWEKKLTTIDEGKVIDKGLKRKHWHNSNINDKKIACKPVFDMLDKAIKENALTSLDIAILFEFKTKLVELREAHILLNKSSARATLLSNISNLDELVTIVDKEITAQLIALGASDEKAVEILALQQDRALDEMAVLYCKQPFQENEARSKLIFLYQNQKISKQQFIFACKAFGQNEGVKAAFISIYERDVDIAPMVIVALQVAPNKSEQLVSLIELFTDEKLTGKEFTFACEQFDKDDVVSMISSAVDIQHKDKKAALINFLQEEMINKTEFIFICEKISSNPGVTNKFILAMRSGDSTMSKKLLNRFRNGQISEEVFNFALEHLLTRNSELAKAIQTIGGISDYELKARSYGLLFAGQITEDAFIAAARVLEKDCMNFNDAEGIIGKGEKANAVDKDGKTALHYAAAAGRIDAAKYLIEKGADITAKDNQGRTALDCAEMGGHKDVVKLLTNKRIALLDFDGTAEYYENLIPALKEMDEVYYFTGRAHNETIINVNRGIVTLRADMEKNDVTKLSHSEIQELLFRRKLITENRAYLEKQGVNIQGISSTADVGATVFQTQAAIEALEKTIIVLFSKEAYSAADLIEISSSINALTEESAELPHGKVAQLEQVVDTKIMLENQGRKVEIFVFDDHAGVLYGDARRNSKGIEEGKAEIEARYPFRLNITPVLAVSEQNPGQNTPKTKWGYLAETRRNRLRRTPESQFLLYGAEINKQLAKFLPDSQGLKSLQELSQAMKTFDNAVRSSEFPTKEKQGAYAAANNELKEKLPAIIGANKEAVSGNPKTFEQSCTELASKGTKGKKIAASLGMLSGAATIVAGVALVVTGIAGVLASLTSMGATLGVSSPVALPGVVLSGSLIAEGLAVIAGGTVIFKKSKEKYNEACRVEESLKQAGDGLLKAATAVVVAPVLVPSSSSENAMLAGENCKPGISFSDVQEQREVVVVEIGGNLNREEESKLKVDSEKEEAKRKPVTSKTDPARPTVMRDSDSQELAPDFQNRVYDPIGELNKACEEQLKAEKKAGMRGKADELQGRGILVQQNGSSTSKSAVNTSLDSAKQQHQKDRPGDRSPQKQHRDPMVYGTSATNGHVLFKPCSNPLRGVTPEQNPSKSVKV